MRVNVLMAHGESLYVDTLDLYAARQLQSYIAQAAVELRLVEEILKADLGRVLLKLERLQEAHIRKALEPKPVEVVKMDEAERQTALALSKSPDLLGRRRVVRWFKRCQREVLRRSRRDGSRAGDPGPL